MNVCHGGNSDDLGSIPPMTGTVAVNFVFISLDYEKYIRCSASLFFSRAFVYLITNWGGESNFNSQLGGGGE